LTAAAALDDLTYQAPKAPGGAGVSRFLADVGTSVTGQVVGAATLGADLVRSLPFVGADDNRAKARHDSLEAAKAMAQPWLAVEQMLQQLESGRGGLAAGAAVGAVVTHKVDLPLLDKTKLFKGHSLAPGFLRGLPQGALSIPEEVRAWTTAHEVKEFEDQIAERRSAGTPLSKDWMSDALDLRQHEARGGHTLLKHAGSSIDRLQWRLNLESGDVRSTFADVQEANSLVSGVLQAHRSMVLVFTKGKDPRLLLELPLVNPRGVVLDQAGLLSRGRSVRVVLRRDSMGEVYVYTAMVDR